jgi:hypothetical protein
MEERIMLKLKLLKILFMIYGAYVFLISLILTILLYVHEDLLLIKAPTKLEWIAGDLVLILQMLWGILVALSAMIKRPASRKLAILSLLLALIIYILVGWINWKMGSFLGVPLVIFLLLLPSLLLIGTQNARIPPRDAPSP